MRSAKTLTQVAVATLLAIFAVGCSKEAKIAKGLERASGYMAAEDFASAELEYLNVLRQDGRNAEAMTQMAQIYYRQGRYFRALQFLQPANQLAPGNPDTMVASAFVSLLADQSEAARQFAFQTLQVDPGNRKAPMLLTERLASPADAIALLGRLEEFKKAAPENIGILCAQASIQTKLNRFAPAEALVNQALAIDAESPLPHSVLANIHFSQGKLEEALASYRTAVNVAHNRDQLHIAFARFLRLQQKSEQAVEHLRKIVQGAPDFVPALTLLAELEAQQGDLEKALELNTRALRIEELDHNALVNQGKLHLAREEYEKAVSQLRSVVEIFPNSLGAHLNLAYAYLGSKDDDAAVPHLSRSLALNPNQPALHISLAEIYSRREDYSAAIINLKKAIELAPKQVLPVIELAKVYELQGNESQALQLYQQIAEAAPENVQTLVLLSNLHLKTGNTEKAKIVYERILEIEPNSILAIQQLARIELATEGFETALARVDRAIETIPEQTAALRLLKGQLLSSQGKRQEAEAEFIAAIELDPENRAAYLFLAQSYLEQGSEEQALVRLEELLAQKPDDLAALMQKGVILDESGQLEKARDTYETLLSHHPEYTAALNNLAYIYSETFEDLDRAFELAEKARNLNPTDPYMADTLGWIVFKQGELPWALSLISEAANKLPDHAEIKYHLGRIHYQKGDISAAREAFVEAIALSPDSDFAGKDDAQSRIAIIDADPENLSDEQFAAISEKADQGDVIAALRIAEYHASKNENDKAFEKLEKLLETNPDNATALHLMASVQFDLGESEQAYETIKKAQKLRPDDPNVVLKLSEIAIVSGDSDWAYGLLTTLNRTQNEAEASTNLLLANAAFHRGSLEIASEALKTASQLDPNNPQVDALNALLALPETPEAIADQLEAAEDMQGTSLARLVRARVKIFQGEEVEATQELNDIIKSYPQFAPAKRELARLLVIDDENDSRVQSLLRDIHGQMADDPVTQFARGIIAFRRGDFSQAANLLGEIPITMREEADRLLYLGLSQLEQGEEEAGKATLAKASAAGADPDRIRQALAEEAES